MHSSPTALYVPASFYFPKTFEQPYETERYPHELILLTKFREVSFPRLFTIRFITITM